MSKRLSTELRPTQRRWRDLSKRRLLFSLAAAPVAPVVAGFLLIAVVIGVPNDGADFAGSILGVAIVWSLVLGAAYLLCISRWRGLVGRIECLMLGIIAAATLPVLGILLLGSDPSFRDPFTSDLSSDAGGIAIILAIMLTPFGVLGGWVFWRLGVRPVATTTVDVAPVFD
jgi:hypothetical protein